MPFKRTDSPYYQISPRVVLPGRGRVRLPARSAGTTSKQLAQDMEVTLRQLPMIGFSELVERYIEDPSLTPGEIHSARLAHRLHELLPGRGQG